MAKLSTWCFEYFGDISCSLLGNPSQTNESNIYIYIYIYIDEYLSGFILMIILVALYMYIKTKESCGTLSFFISNMVQASSLRVACIFKVFGTQICLMVA